MNAHTLQLCREYIELVDAMRSGRYSMKEIYQLESQRLILHTDLCTLLKVEWNVDMYHLVRGILMGRRGSNQQ